MDDANQEMDKEEWNADLSSAPRDGTTIQVCHRSQGIIEKVHFLDGHWCLGDASPNPGIYRIYEGNLTHWRLPPLENIPTP